MTIQSGCENLEVALKDWRTIVKKYQLPGRRSVVIQLLNTFVPFIGICILMYYSLVWSYLATLGLAVLNGLFLLRIFVIQHDCGHHSFTSSRGLNIAIGVFCSLFTFIPFSNWKRVHNAHHAHNGKMEYRGLGDINFLTTEEYGRLSRMGKIQYRLVRLNVVQFLIIPVIYIAVIQQFPYADIKKKKRLFVWHFINQLLIVSVYCVLGLLIGWQKVALVQVPIVIVFGIVAFWLFYVQHQHEENYNEWRDNWDHLPASILGSSFYHLPKWARWFSGDIGYHHIHHLSPRIPNYRLEECFKENPVFREFVTTLNFRQSLKCVGHRLWDENEKRMITFDQYLKGQTYVER